jgi:hypothetical protein
MLVGLPLDVTSWTIEELHNHFKTLLKTEDDVLEELILF